MQNKIKPSFAHLFRKKSNNFVEMLNIAETDRILISYKFK